MPTENPATPAPAAAATTSSALGAPAHETARMTWRRLRRAGLSAREAGSLTAHLEGLRPVHGGWAIEEVEHLLFVRALVDAGRMGS